MNSIYLRLKIDSLDYLSADCEESFIFGQAGGSFGSGEGSDWRIQDTAGNISTTVARVFFDGRQFGLVPESDLLRINGVSHTLTVGKAVLIEDADILEVCSLRLLSRAGTRHHVERQENRFETLEEASCDLDLMLDSQFCPEMKSAGTALPSDPLSLLEEMSRTGEASGAISPSADNNLKAIVVSGAGNASIDCSERWVDSIAIERVENTQHLESSDAINAECWSICKSGNFDSSGGTTE